MQLYIMDLFLGRRFFNLGSNIFNYAILRAALNEVDPITLIRRITCFTLYYTEYLHKSDIPLF